VVESYPQPGVELTYVKLSGESTGDAGDQYTGLDRFGRVVDQRWIVTSTGAATDRFQYGYDQDSNVLYRNNLVNTSFGELYHANGSSNGYDNLNRLTNFARGVLSASGSTLDTINSPSETESWSLDAVGNWPSVTLNGTAQNRTANQQNEITSISGLTTPGYDLDGNTTTDQAGKTLVYDAWNRLVAYKSGSTTLVAWTYDALGRQATVNFGTLTSLYYNSSWQVVEEQQSGSMVQQYVWNPLGVDSMVERDTTTQRLYVESDANGNVTSVIDTSGNVQERYMYDPYGAVTVLTPTWTVRSGGSSFGWVYLFQGGRYEATSTLYGFRNRNYSPTLGRWVQNDPTGFGGGSDNFYAFVGANPVTGSDPSGLVPAVATLTESEGGSSGNVGGTCCSSTGGPASLEAPTTWADTVVGWNDLLTFGLSTKVMASRTFGAGLNGVDSVVVGFDDQITGGGVSRKRMIIWGGDVNDNLNPTLHKVGRGIGVGYTVVTIVAGAHAAAQGAAAVLQGEGGLALFAGGNGGAALSLEGAGAAAGAAAPGLAVSGFGIIVANNAPRGARPGDWPKEGGGIPRSTGGGLTKREIWTARREWLEQQRQTLRKMASDLEANGGSEVLDNIKDQIQALTDQIAEAAAILKCIK